MEEEWSGGGEAGGGGGGGGGAGGGAALRALEWESVRLGARTACVEGKQLKVNGVAITLEGIHLPQPSLPPPTAFSHLRRPSLR